MSGWTTAQRRAWRSRHPYVVVYTVAGSESVHSRHRSQDAAIAEARRAERRLARTLSPSSSLTVYLCGYYPAVRVDGEWQRID